MIPYLYGAQPYMPSTWAQLLVGNSQMGCNSTGMRWWVLYCRCEQFDGCCTVCLRDVLRLLSLALRQSSTTMQPTQKPRAEFRPPQYGKLKRNRKQSEFVRHRRAPTYFWFSRLLEQELYSAINFLHVAHNQATRNWCSKGIT